MDEKENDLNFIYFAVFLPFISQIMLSALTHGYDILLILLSFVGIRRYIVDKINLDIFCQKIKIASMWHDDEPNNLVIGNLYIGYITFENKGEHEGGIIRSLSILCFEKWYKREISEMIKSSISKGELETTIKFFDRIGASYNIDYNEFKILVPNFAPYPIQKDVIDETLVDFDKNGYSTCLLYGPTTSGKSTICRLLAREMLNDGKCPSLVDSYDPMTPNDNFYTMYSKIKPSSKSPLIVVLEEVDILVTSMHLKNIKTHKYLSIDITNKRDWNNMFDRFDRKQYLGVIFIMTSNLNIDYFDSLDKSYFNDTRVNIKRLIGK
jgi:hypothetical protein